MKNRKRKKTAKQFLEDFIEVCLAPESPVLSQDNREKIVLEYRRNAENFQEYRLNRQKRSQRQLEQLKKSSNNNIPFSPKDSKEKKKNPSVKSEHSKDAIKQQKTKTQVQMQKQTKRNNSKSNQNNSMILESEVIRRARNKEKELLKKISQKEQLVAFSSKADFLQSKGQFELAASLYKKCLEMSGNEDEWNKYRNKLLECFLNLDDYQNITKLLTSNYKKINEVNVK